MSAVPIPVAARTRSSYAAGIPVMVTLALGVFALWPALASLVEYWREIPDYEHGFLVAAVSALWLGIRFRQFDRAAAAPRVRPQLCSQIRPQPWALVPLALLLALWWIALRGISHMAFQLLIPPILWLGVFAAAGPRAARLAAAPLAYFYFAIPVWDYLLPVLQHGTVWAAETGMGAIGIATKVVGNVVTIPEGTFVVQEDCSGKRFVLVALAFAGLLGPIHRLTATRQTLLFLLAVAVAVVANWIRVWFVIYAGHVTHMQHYWVRISHIGLGNEIFVVLLVLILLGARRLARGDAAHVPLASQHETATGHSETSETREPTADPATHPISPTQKWAPALLFTVSGLLVSAFPTAPQAGPAHLGDPPVLTGRWNGPLPAHADWQPDYPGAVDTLQVVYDGQHGPVQVYLNLYTNQTPGRKLIQYGNSILTPEEWVQTTGPRWQEAFAGTFGATPLTLTAHTKSGDRWAIAYGYVVAGHRTASALIAQLESGAASLFQPAGSGVIAVAARCSAADCRTARRSILAFWDEESSRFASIMPRQIPRILSGPSSTARGADRP